MGEDPVDLVLVVEDVVAEGERMQLREVDTSEVKRGEPADREVGVED